MARTKQVESIDITASKQDQAVDAKKKRRRKRGRKSLSEIKQAQKEVAPCCRRAPLNRLLREIVQGFNPELQIKKEALNALRVAAEAFTIDRLKQSLKCTVNRGSQTLAVKDMRTAQSISSHADVNS
jgi:histone H3/H4